MRESTVHALNVVFIVIHAVLLNNSLMKFHQVFYLVDQQKMLQRYDIFILKNC